MGDRRSRWRTLRLSERGRVRCMLFIYDSPNGGIVEQERLYNYEYALNAYDEAKDCHKRLISVEAGGIINGKVNKRNF